MKEVIILTGAGQIGMAIARRVGYGKTIIIGDKRVENAHAVARTLTESGFDVVATEVDIASRTSIQRLIALAQEQGDIAMLINAAGVSPSQAPVETILEVDLYGTAVLLEEVGKVIKSGGSGVTISSQSGHRMAALTAEEDEQLATTPTEELLSLDILRPNGIKDTLHGYQLAKRCNVKHFGLFEAGSDTIRRAHKILPVTAVQNQYAIWTRTSEYSVIPTCDELGIGFVPWGPLGTGFLTGKISVNDIFDPKTDLRASFPRFSKENMEANMPLVFMLNGMEERKGVSTVQIALAWLLVDTCFLFVRRYVSTVKHKS